MECKNYSEDPANPELDQLNGRLSEDIGMFGMLFCRNIRDRDLMRARCHDLVAKQGHFLLVLDDDDICELLQMMDRGGPDAVSERLDELLALILLQ